MDPNQFRPPPTTTSSTNDSAILFLDGTDPFGHMPFVPPPASPAMTSSGVAPDGLQILDQVQKELQFLPSNETAYVTGTISAGTSSAPPFPGKAPVGSLSGLMDSGSGGGRTLASPPNADTDYLIGTDPISLGSPLSPMSVMNADGPSSNKIKHSIWQFEYYAQYFDLSTDIFFRRVLWSFLPLTGDHKGTYIERHIQANPDLYGPFWIALTLAFVVTICDNIVTFLNQYLSGPAALCASAGAHAGNTSGVTHNPNCDHLPPVTLHHLAFTFERMHLSLLITFTYVFLAPLILWSFCQWRACAKLYTFLECLCAYGYSLSAFIPVAIVSLIDIRELQFILFASAAFMSGSVLLISFAPVVHSDPSRNIKFSYIMLVFIFVAHFTIALFYLYMFL